MNCPSCNADNDDLNSVCDKCGFVFEETDDLDSFGTQYDDSASESMSGFKTTAGITDLKNALSQGTLFAKRYEILDKGMFGGMGAVYKVMDKELLEVVALKLILPEYVNNKSAVERFKQEVKIARNLVHPNLVRVYDLGESDKIKYFTMEYIEGSNLRDLLDIRKKNNKPFSLEEAFHIISQLCDALHYAHEFTIHRDIKPENILMPKDEKGNFKVKVTDFGLAKMITPSKLSMTTHRMGTAYYMSPEQQIDSSSVDKRADIYSLGVILYELLTLILPVGRYESVSSKRPDLPPAIDAVVDRAMEIQPEKRFSDADDMHKALKSVLEHPKEEPVIDTPEQKSDPKKKAPIKTEEKKPVIDDKVQIKTESKSSNKNPVIAGIIAVIAVAAYFGLNSMTSDSLDNAAKSNIAPPKSSEQNEDRIALKKIEGFMNSSRLYLNKKEFDMALAEIDKVLKIDTGNAEAYSLKSEIEADKKIYEFKKQQVNAKKERQQKVSSQSSEHIASSKVYLKKKDFDMALAEIDKALKLDPGSAGAYSLKSEIESEKKINEFKIQKARAEKERQQEEITQYLNKGKDYFSKGKYQLSIEKMKEVINRDSDNYEANKYIKMANQKLDAIKRQFNNPIVGRSR